MGHRGLARHGLSLAAVAATAPGSVVSHCSAAWLWGINTTFVRPVEVTVPRTGKRRRDIVVHHAPDLAKAERARYERIPVTSVPRTLFDLAAPGSGWDLASAVDRAKRRGKLDLVAIDELLARRRGEAGTVALREAVDLYRAPVSDRAKSELLFLALVRKAGLPTPALNVWVESFEIDAWWERERFAIEVDGWESHGTRRAFEQDRVRIEDLRLSGIDVIQVTARRIERQPGEVARPGTAPAAAPARTE